MAMLLRANDSGGYLPLAGGVNIADVEGYGSLPNALNDPRRRRYVYINATGVGLLPTDELPASPPESLLPYFGVNGVSLEDGLLRGWDDLKASHRTLELFECPSASELQENFPLSIMLLVEEGGYHIGSEIPIDYAYNGGVMGFDYRRQTESRRGRGLLTRVKDASATLLMADAPPHARQHDRLGAAD